MIPSRSMSLACSPLSSAPAYLQPYLDAVDGAMFVRCVAEKNAVRETWILFRAGEQVGEVTIDLGSLT